MARRKTKRRVYGDSNRNDTIRKQVVRNRTQILEGVMLCVDPSSGSKDSNAGYALFDRGRLVESGVIYDDADKKLDIYQRLRVLADWLAKYDCADVLVVEKIRSKAHTYLRWACGVTVATNRAPVVMELSPITWHKYTPDDYQKTDEDDAKWFGYTVLQILREETK